ncbi:MAG: hypothetical protein GEV05_29470 [Betaproteobacteria bacterium]|nr:hypothetical protein [Betaproteobacteria bacterium]
METESCWDGQFSEATTATLGRVRVSGFRPLPIVRGVFGELIENGMTLRQIAAKFEATALKN